MSLADFPFPSKFSRGIRRPKSQVSHKSRQQKCNDDLHIMKRYTRDSSLRNSQRSKHVEIDELKNSGPEDILFHFPNQLGCDIVDVPKLNENREPQNPMLRPRRPPWTSPGRPLLKSLYPRMVSELEEFARSQNHARCAHDDNCSPTHKNSDPPGLGPDTNKPPISTVTLPTVNAINRKQRAQKKEIQTTKISVPKQTINTGQIKAMKNRKELQAKRKERMELAKKKRNNLYNAKIKKIEETLEKKEQKRLQSIRCKEITMRQTKLLTAIILASATQRWLENAPKMLAECRRKKLLEEATIKIQTMWKKEMFVRKAIVATIITKKLKSCGWRIKLHARCTRRSLYAKVIRTFFMDMTKHPLSFALYQFRMRVLKAQRMTRKFLDCKKARLDALEELWRRVEREVIVKKEESKSKRRRRKNALSDITHRKILSKGLVGIVKGVVDHEPQSSVPQVNKLTPHETYRVLCQFHLEDSRRTFKEHTPEKVPSRIHELTHYDARKLLEGFDVDRLAQYHTARPYPPFLLYSRHDELRKKIEGMKK